MKKKTWSTIFELVRIVAAFLAGVLGGNNSNEVMTFIDSFGSFV